MIRVLRLQPGDEVLLLDGHGLASSARIVSAQSARVDLALTDLGRKEADTLPIHLLVAVLKRERMEWLMEKAAELAVASIRPVITDRTVVRLEPKRSVRRRERWQAISCQALKQCRGATVSEVASIGPFDEAISAVSSCPGKVFLWEQEEGRGLLSSWDLQGRATPLALLVGPEGGFTTQEVTRCREAGFVPATLGRRTLRAETAALAALAVLKAAMEEREEASSL